MPRLSRMAWGSIGLWSLIVSISLTRPVELGLLANVEVYIQDILTYLFDIVDKLSKLYVVM